MATEMRLWMIVGVFVGAVSLAGEEWTTVSRLQSPRCLMSATLLCDGRILIAGGMLGPGGVGTPATALCELFDPESDTTRATSPMNIARAGHSAVRLRDGRVLVVGGQEYGGDYSTLSSCEIYDPVAGNWSFTGSLSCASITHGLILLDDGQVLKIAGLSPSWATTTCEIYDPQRGSWRLTGATSQPHGWPACIKLDDGRVIAAGGNRPMTGSVEVFDPSTHKWSLVGSLSNMVSELGIANMADGSIMFLGGLSYSGSYSFYRSVDVYDPMTGTIGAGPDMLNPRSSFHAARLPNGNIMAIGGANLIPGTASWRTIRECDVYELSTRSWNAGPRMVMSRDWYGAASTEEAVYIFGGRHIPEDGAEPFVLDSVEAFHWGCAPCVKAIVDLAPDTLNVRSGGQYVTCHITLPAGYDPSQIDASTVEITLVDGEGGSGLPVPIDPPFAPAIEDYDEDGILDLTVKFSRQKVVDIPLQVGERKLTVEGRLGTGRAFKGEDVVRVIDRGK